MVLGKRGRQVLHSGLLKFILIGLAALFFAGAGEVIWNYHALLEGYPDLDLTSQIKTNRNSVVCEYEFEKDTYISKLRMHGEFGEDSTYILELVTDNGFGVETNEVLEDQVYSVFSEAFTNVNRTVRKLTLSMSSAENIEIDQLVVSNHFDFNKYRFLFLSVIFFLTGVAFGFKNILENKQIEYYFVVFSLGFGLLMNVMSGPRYLTWDEDIHYRNVHNLSSDEMVDWNAAAWYNYHKDLPDTNTKEELYMLRQYQNENADIAFHSSQNPAGFDQMAMRSYFPMVLFYKLGEMSGLSYSNQYMLGRIGNLLFCVLILWFAIHAARERKILIFSLSVLPTVLFQESMFTYDGVLYSLIVLGFVFLLNEFTQIDKVNVPQLTAAIALIVVGCFSKAVYVPMLLLTLALPNSKFENKRQAYLFKACACIVFLLMMSTFVLPVLSSSAETNLAYSDARGGDTGVLAQLVSMLQHPIATVKLFVSSIFSFDNFRNLGYEAADNYLITNLMFLNFASLGVLADKWSLLLIPLLFLLFFVPNEKVQAYSRMTKIWLAILMLGTVALVWLAMYLSFTTVGSETIEGVQARYYLPLLLPLSCITLSNRFVRVMKEKTYNTVVVSINGVLIVKCIYELLLQSRCF